MTLAAFSHAFEEMDQADAGCHKIIREAQTELGAFHLSVRQLYGEEVALRACHLWLEELTSLAPETTVCWRSVTIAAASRLAQSLGFVRSLQDSSG